MWFVDSAVAGHPLAGLVDTPPQATECKREEEILEWHQAFINSLINGHDVKVKVVKPPQQASVPLMDECELVLYVLPIHATVETANRLLVYGSSIGER
jgi:hypothetical protein